MDFIKTLNMYVLHVGLLSVGVVMLTGCMTSLGGEPEGDRLVKIRASSNYQNGSFVNLKSPIVEPVQPKEKNKGLGIMRAIRWAFRDDGSQQSSSAMSVEHRTSKDFDVAPKSGLRVTWLGHTSFMIEIDGKRLLADPHFSERSSPVQWAGPKRLHPSPIDINNIPRVDAVIISHDHYDHLDQGTIVELAKTSAKFVVPLGVGSHLEKWGVEEDAIVELDWWESFALDGTELVATPAQHFSGRLPSKRNYTLWASWLLLGQKQKVMFAGDTGYGYEFKKIGEQYGPFDVTIMPIGAYSDNWPVIHMTPEEAVKAHTDVKGKYLVPSHWGTFVLAPHTNLEPIERYKVAASKNNVQFLDLKPGSMFEPAL